MTLFLFLRSVNHIATVAKRGHSLRLVALQVDRHARDLPGLGPVAVEDLVSSEQVQFAMALLKHVDSRQPASRGNQSLLHTGWVYQLSI